MQSEAKYIFVDLDRTLVRTDLFVESVLKLIKANPLRMFSLLIWILQGRSYAKDRVARLVDLDMDYLPFENQLIDYLREQKDQGKKIVLATASNQRYAHQVADYLGLFDRVIASDVEINLKGMKKLAAILREADGRSFAYAGDSVADRPIWAESCSNILVNAPRSDVERAKRQGKAEKIIASPHSLGRALLKEMRIHQWAKNLLVFVPMFTSHAYIDVPTLISAALAFLCFGICASGVYFLNDMLDLEADRRHLTKSNRPLASGELPLTIGMVGAAGLPLAAFAIALLFLPLSFVGVLLVYYLLTNAYSFFLKRVSTADVMTLAVLYTLRVVAGSEAVDIELSSWLMAFSVFVFVSLAYLKRYIEVSALSEADEKAHVRGYSAADTETMFSLGASTITASVVVLALYINSDEVAVLYRTPELLWGLCLLMLYWGNRIWIGARRGKIFEDPVVFAIKDRVSQMVGAAFVVVVLLARYV